MTAADHKTAAEDLERALADLGDPAAKPYIRRLLMESYFGTAFHWIAYGTATKHGSHKENHSGLVSFLRGLGEQTVATRWQALENLRNGGWYGRKNSLQAVQEAEAAWQEIRTWALS